MLIKMKINIYFYIFSGSFMHNGVFAQTDFLISSNFGYEFLNKFSNFHNINTTKSQQSLCEKQLTILSENLNRNQLWALKFIDAWAKIPAGVLYGNHLEMGNFDECLSLSENVLGGVNMKGKYCLADLQEKSTSLEHRQDSADSLGLELGICIPAACSASEAELLVQKYFEEQLESTWKNVSISINEQKCTQADRGPLKALDWVAVTLILLGVLMLMSTSYDYLQPNQVKEQNSLLGSFSVRSNMRQLMKMTSSANMPRHMIPALDGIRCLSLIWIIYLHSFAMLIKLPSVNKVEMRSWIQSPFFLIWVHGNFAADTYLFLSGMLLISVAFREMEKKSGKLNIPLMYLHRFVRLSPVLYLAVLLFMTLFRFCSNGPLWFTSISTYQLCEDTWWATLLYVQNYAAADKMCLFHSWYLAADTQLYILSPIVLILIWKWRRWGITALLFIGLLLMAYSIATMIFKNIYLTLDMRITETSEWTLTFYVTHTRASPWIIGVAFGYFMHRHSGKHVVLSKPIVFCSWLISVALFVTVVFALYPKTQPNANSLSPLESAFCVSLSRIAWPLGLCWLIFACVNGYGGPINSFLSCKFWQPMAKLSYCIYVWHNLVILVNGNRIKTNIHFSTYDAMLHWWSNFGITILLSTVMYLAIEAPMLKIEKILLGKNPKQTGEDNLR